MPKSWTNTEINILLDHYETKGAAYVRQKTGRSVFAVYKKAQDYGLIGERWKSLDEHDKDLIVELAKDLPVLEIAKKFETTKNNIERVLNERKAA